MNLELLAILLTVMLIGVIGLVLTGLIYLLEKHFGWEHIGSVVAGFFSGVALVAGSVSMFGHYLFHKLLPYFYVREGCK